MWFIRAQYIYTNEEIAHIVGEGTTSIIVSDIKKRSSWTEVSKDYTFISRKQRLFSDNDIHVICNYFENNPKQSSLNNKEYCAIVLSSLGYEVSEASIDSIRHVYDRKHYTNISQYYNY